ncbi:hypothetical protein J23TS9_01630 [Paenibacillus sp. J23TS9]|uniref:hypothetical protein n=1 Tax=Paenibacillus sp. J23TS9 TaxID=2807193 RepID=UPI001B0ABA28|nr:hypothetical protein [Paenibacillus sp. J23TS9]GIP25033.1 hypothetical protein J23TS9_01630 [Paenibacillus sp. J23TS9]
MATHRVKKAGKDPPPFTRIDNSMLHDERLSFKARGLLAYMLSKPDTFRFYLDELIKHTTEKKDSIRTGMKELEQLGYVNRYPVKNERGKIMSWELDIFESPSLRPESGFPVVENPTLVTNGYILTNDKRFNKYIAFENIENPYFKTYLKHYAMNKKKQHMRITEEQYQTIGEQIDQLQSFGVTAEEWEAEIMEHFKELPKSKQWEYHSVPTCCTKAV